MRRHLGKTSAFARAWAFRRKIGHQRGSGMLHAEVQRSAWWVSVTILATVSVLLWPLVACAGQQQPSPKLQVEMNAGQATPQPQSATPLANLIEEAERNNPSIIAARRAWQAAEQVPSQVSTLPDPQVVVQQLNVGSPRPFAGFSNNNFAYTGFGISQDLPYPGKLRLRGEIARRKATAQGEQVEVVRRTAVEQLKATYFSLAYIQETLGILRRDDQLLKQIEQIAEARYRVGQGNQQDVLKAQLEQTKLLRETALDRQELGTFEARLKQILNRPTDSPDITAETLTETPLPYTSDELLAFVATGNPNVGIENEIVRQQGLQVALAHKDFYPDFNVQYMYQRTGLQFPAYYMLTFGVKIPIYRRRKQEPELAESIEQLNSSRRLYEAQVQREYFDVQDQFLAARTGAQVLKIYRQGLIPQATATFNAGLAAYQQGREDFETLVDSFLDVLNLDQEYWRTLADHETALARIQELTGVTLP